MSDGMETAALVAVVLVVLAILGAAIDTILPLVLLLMAIGG